MEAVVHPNVKDSFLLLCSGPGKIVFLIELIIRDWFILPKEIFSGSRWMFFLCQDFFQAFEPHAKKDLTPRLPTLMNKTPASSL